MASRTIVVSALNIVLPAPHQSERYRELWLNAYSSQRPVRLRKDTGGLIRGAHTAETMPDRIWGDLLKFTNIDDDRWFDLGTGEIAHPKDVEQNVVIPESYRANLHSVPYLFFPKQHRLLFLSRVDQRNTLTPGMAKILIERFLNREATVSIEPDRETLKRIFELPKLKSITMEISPPNALGHMERKLLEYLEEENATRFRQELSTDRQEGLRLTEETREKAEVAQSHGFVNGSGTDDTGRVVHLSTRDHPYSQLVAYDTNLTTAHDAFETEAQKILQEIITPAGQRE